MTPEELVTQLTDPHVPLGLRMQMERAHAVNGVLRHRLLLVEIVDRPDSQRSAHIEEMFADDVPRNEE
jgi:hypothetical protein